jgi:cell division protein FtsZ
MDMPAPRLPDLKAPAPAAPAAPAAAPEEEAPRRAGLFNRWTSAARPAAPQQQRTEPKPPAPTQPASRPAAPATSAARVSPGDRLTTSRSEEDMLDIPAFLRRQAN